MNIPLLFLIIVIAILLNGWWWAVAVYTDVKRRNLKNRIGWALMALILNNWGAQLYMTFTKRPQTALSLSPAGIIAGDKLQKVKSRNWILFFSVLLFGLWIYQLSGFIGRGISIDEIYDEQKYGLEFLFTPFIILYLIFSYFSHGKLNPLDKPLWGMKSTSEGPVDESITKHKKWVIILSVFIATMILVLAGMIIYGLVKYF